MAAIGNERTEQLHTVLAKLRGPVTIRQRYARRTCEPPRTDGHVITRVVE